MEDEVETKFEVGLIGAGAIAVESHIPVLKGIKNVEVVVMCDSRVDVAKAAASKFDVKSVLRLLEITRDLSRDSAAFMVISNLTSELQRRGHIVKNTTVVLDLDRSNKISDAPCVIPKKFAASFLGSFFGRFLVDTILYVPLFLRSFKMFKQEQFDIVISHYHNHHLGSFVAHIVSKLQKKPHVIFVHDLHSFSQTSQRVERIYDRLMFSINTVPLENADKIFVQSQGIKKELEVSFKVESDKIAVLPNCVDVDFFLDRSIHESAIVQIREKYQLAQDKVILYLGTAYRNSGAELLLEALPSVLEKGCKTSIMFLGWPHAQDVLSKIADELGVSQKVIFAGAVSHDNVPLFLALADVAVGHLGIVGTKHTIPVKVLEYMAAGKPVVALQYSVTDELLTDGYNGLLLHKADKDELAELLVRLLQDPSYARNLGLNAQKTVIENYDVKVVGQRLETELYNIIPKKKQDEVFQTLLRHGHLLALSSSCFSLVRKKA